MAETTARSVTRRVFEVGPVGIELLRLLHTEGPIHPWGIVKRRKDQLGRGYRQIYRLFTQLERVGFAQSREAAQSSGPGRPRRVYRVSELGARVAERLDQLETEARMIGKSA